MAVPMEKLDDLVASHMEDRLLQPERLEIILSAVLDRRQEQSGRRREHIAELNKRAAESDLRLKRLCDAIEAGVADIGDPALKDRIDGLKVIRDQARVDAELAQAMLENSGGKAVTPQMLHKLAETARQRHPARRRRLSPLSLARAGAACRSVRGRGSDRRIEVSAAPNDHSENSVNSAPIHGLKVD
jgi:hypothetical protein